MEALRHLEAALNENFPERQDLIRGLILGLLTGKHILFVGAPGTGKSMLVNEFVSRLEGGRKFSYLMTRYTRPEEIIGSISLKHLENDEFKRVLTGRIADAHFVFLDEIFNVNSGCANTILTIMNEGTYCNGTETIIVPLITMIGASNEIPADAYGELAAFYDRFLLRYQVDYLRDNKNLARIIGEVGSCDINKISLVNISKWQSLVPAIDLPGHIINRLISVINKLRAAGLQISDRRIKESSLVLKANALLEGRSQVAEEDLTVLQHLLWQRLEEKNMIIDQITKITTPLEKRAGKLASEARQTKLRIDGADSRGRRMALGGEVNLRLTEILQELREIRSLSQEEGFMPELIDEAIKEVEEIHHNIIKSCLGFAPELV